MVKRKTICDKTVDHAKKGCSGYGREPLIQRINQIIHLERMKKNKFYVCNTVGSPFIPNFLAYRTAIDRLSF